MGNTVRGGAIAYGALTALFTALFAVPLSAMVLMSSQTRTEGMTIVLSIVALGGGMGAAMAVAGWRSYSRRPASVLRMPSFWLLLAAFAAALVLGILSLHTPLTLLLPALHVIASFLPPLLLLAAVLPAMQRRGVRITRRDVLSQTSFGAIVATAIAIFLESIAGLAVLVLASVAIALLPGGEERLLELGNMMQSPAVLTSPERLLESLFTPGVVMGLGLLVVVITPLIEELVKGLGVPLAATLRPVSRSQAFAFGLMAGAGFSLAEALFYGAAELPHAWAIPVLTRAGTVVIHGAATGLMGIAWYEGMRRRVGRFAAYTVGAVALHGVWNLLGGVLALAALSQTSAATAAGQAFSSGLNVLALFLLGVTWIGAAAIIARQTLRAE